MPVPRTSVNVMADASDSQICRIIKTEPIGSESIPARALSGDPSLIEQTLKMMPDLKVQEKYLRELVGAKQVDAKDFVCVLDQARVAHSSGLVITSDNRVLEGVSCLNFNSDLPTNPLCLRYLPKPSRVSRSAVLVTCTMPYNYYHWIMEALPRLGGYASAGVTAEFVYAPIQKKFQNETLRLLGFPTAKIIRATRNGHTAFDQLAIATSNPSCTSRTIDFLYNAFASHGSVSQPKKMRVYISRRNRGKRVITNDDEVFKELQPLGFQRFDLEAMSVSEQIKLFHDAECVVGPHGAGLVNIAFCRQGTKVIEINTPYRTSTCFYDIAHYRGLRYLLHVARPEAESFFSFDPKTGLGDSDMMVQPTDFAQKVHSFLQDPSAADQSDTFKKYLQI